MIPVFACREPDSFDAAVRIRGNRWLADHPDAKPSDYPPYWTAITLPLREAFEGRCAYLGHWIPAGHVDHFLPKASHRTEVYEWSNYRYADESVNVRKGKRPFLDPLVIEDGWIAINPMTLVFEATEALPSQYHEAAGHTLAVLNSPELLRARQDAIKTYTDERDATAYRLLMKFFPLLAETLRKAGFFEPAVARE